MEVSGFLRKVFWIFCVVFLDFLDINSAQWVVAEDICTTPEGHTAVCMPIKQCAPMVKFLKAVKRPISQEVLNRIRAYGCQGDQAKVCCPPGPITIIGGTSSSSTSSQPATVLDVSGHRNLNLLPRDCGYFETVDKIRNGKDADLNEFPWMALLSYRASKGPSFRCAGSIINRNYILTAAHCITKNEYPLLGVRVGEHSIQNITDCGAEEEGVYKCNPPVQDLRIEEVIPHPQYSSDNFQNDIGLLRVSTMDLNRESVRPVCLPLTADQRNTRLSYVIVTGWGVTDTGNTSDILQKVALEVADKPTCTRLYKTYGVTLTERQLCAGGKKQKDSCPGDSGGPMQYPAYLDGSTKYVQYGIVSFGPKFCGLDGHPGVYTLISYYMNWIIDNMRP